MKIPNSALVGPREAKVRDSIDFHFQTAYVLQMTWEHCEIDYKDWQEILSEVKERETYNHIPPDNPYGSLEAMLIDLGIDLSVAINESKFENRMIIASQNVDNDVRSGNPTSANLGNFSQEIPNLSNSCENNHKKPSRSERAMASGVSVSTQEKLDFLAKDHPNILRRVQSGELRPHTAYKQARGIKDPTALDLLKKYWDKVTQDEQKDFLEWTSLSGDGKR